MQCTKQSRVTTIIIVLQISPPLITPTRIRFPEIANSWVIRRNLAKEWSTVYKNRAYCTCTSNATGFIICTANNSCFWKPKPDLFISSMKPTAWYLSFVYICIPFFNVPTFKTLEVVLVQHSMNPKRTVPYCHFKLYSSEKFLYFHACMHRLDSDIEIECNKCKCKIIKIGHTIQLNVGKKE